MAILVQIVRGHARALAYTVSGVAAHPYAGAIPAAMQRPDGSAASINRTMVTGNWFEVLGVRPNAGRLLRPSDDEKGAAPVAVVSTGAALRFFGGVRDAIGQTLRVDDTSYTIVGVTPRDFDFPRTADVWVPAVRYRDVGMLAWHILVRVGRDATAEQTRGELGIALSALDTEKDGVRINATPFADVVVGDVRPALVVLGSTMFLMWVAASVNVVNLLLVRNTTRERDFAVRTALGATRGQLLMEASVEAAALAAASVAIGLGIAHLALPAFLALAPAELPRLAAIEIDGRALAFAAVAGLIAVVLGTIPALWSFTREPGETLKAGHNRGTTGKGRHRLRGGLVVAQVAIATVVLSTAGLLLRSFDRMQRLDLGFAPDSVVLAEIRLPISRAVEWQRAMSQLAERVAMRPGIRAATAIGSQPFAGTQGADGSLFGEGQALEARATPMVNYEGVDAYYFSAMQLPIVRGRAIDAGDRADSQKVVVINEALATMFWPGQDPIGRRVRWDWEKAADITVVGVAADTRYREFATARPTVYVPYGQGIPVMPRFIAIRTPSPTGLAELVRESLDETVPGGLVLGLSSLPELLTAPLARPRFQSSLVGAFALLGVILAVVGTYSVTALTVRLRTRELGIRLALGAGLTHVGWLVLRQGISLGTAGVCLGVAGATLAGRAVQPMLFEVDSSNPLVFLVTAAMLLLATIGATVVPTRRATRTDPMLVMRND